MTTGETTLAAMAGGTMEIAAPVADSMDKKRPSLIRRLPSSPVAMAGLGLVLFWVILAAIGPLLPLWDPNKSDYMSIANPGMSWDHWLGVDKNGRDMLSRLIYGARTVLLVAPLAVLIAYVVGCAMGLVAGYYRGWVDTIVSRTADVILSFPLVVLYVILIATIGPSLWNVVLAVVLASSPGIMRIVRGLVISIINNEYVSAAYLRRENDFYVMLAELLPNCRGPLITDICLRLGFTTITIGTLGFLGLGLPPPTPDWGGMVHEGTSLLTTQPHISLFPCIAIVSLILGFNLLADGVGELALQD
jgi:peptide/nickel transport system permease protein